jgi:hypothetical protein
MDRGHKKALRLLLEQHPIVASWPTSAVVSFFEAIGLHQYASTMDSTPSLPCSAFRPSAIAAP